MNKITIIFCFFAILFTTTIYAQKVELKKVEPAFWWAGMKNQNLQLLIYADKISETTVEIQSDLVSIEKVNKATSPNYYFIDLKIKADAKPGKFDIKFLKNKKIVATYSYELKERVAQKRGFSNADVLYLLMPDRFSNGDPTNDNPAGILEKPDRANPNGRHLGDLKGVLNKLDYFKELGVTGLWLNPFLENNMPAYSYHGYAITDFYKTDARMGTNEEFKNLTAECHKKGLKMIMDQVFNHCGSYYWWMNDLPFADWIHQFSEYTPSNYRGETNADPYASEFDLSRMQNGWFDRTMPDLNQKNQFLLNYLIQNSIWWVEYAGLDGIRMDTYPYPDKQAMAEWADRLHQEYPDITLLGETWMQKEAFMAYYQNNTFTRDGYRPNLNSVTDFSLHYAFNDAFNQNDGWTDGLSRIYYCLAQDFLYGDPYNNVTFLDNHDVSRYLTTQQNNYNKLKMGLGLMLTTRGIPVIYYGTEILMAGDAGKGHGFIREDFPGGWPGDKQNAFTAEGRTKEQNDAFDFTKKLIQYRVQNSVLQTGKLLHFIPENGIYVFFRYNETETVMVILNNNNTEAKTIETKRYTEKINGFTKGTDIITGEKLNSLEKISIDAKSIKIIELEK